MKKDPVESQNTVEKDGSRSAPGRETDGKARQHEPEPAVPFLMHGLQHHHEKAEGECDAEADGDVIHSRPAAKIGKKVGEGVEDEKEALDPDGDAVEITGHQGAEQDKKKDQAGKAGNKHHQVFRGFAAR